MNKMAQAIPATIPCRKINPPRDSVEKLARRMASELSVTPKIHVLLRPSLRMSHSD